MSQWVCRATLVLFVLGCAGAVAAQEEGDAKKEEASTSGPTHKVEPGPFKVVVNLSGHYEAAQAAEISIVPEVWSSFRVTEAAPQGQMVKEGDVLVAFDTEGIEQEIRDIEAGKKLAELNLTLTEKELEFYRKFQPLDLEAARRSKRIADEDLAQWKEVQRDFDERSVKENEKGQEYFLEYAEEELKQLQKMYEADDLTEETEEIVLKRAQRRVDSARFYLELARASTKRRLALDIPRQDEHNETRALREALDLEKTELTFPMHLAKKEMEMEKALYDRKKAEERLQKLQADLEKMVIRSPSEGVVYYGSCDRGRWTGSENFAKQLRPGGNIAPHQVFMTVVQPRPMTVRVDLPEKDLRYLSAGVGGKVEPVAFPERKHPCKVSQISPIPVKMGTFDAVLSVEPGEGSDAIVPGMACNVELVPYENPKALTVPGGAIFRDDDEPYVYLVTGEDEHEKRSVTLGKHGGDRVEITKGLEEGDQILLQKP